MKATLGGKPVPRYRPIYVRKEAILTFGFAQTGSRAYLSVAGGFDVPQVMESKSTYLRAKIGGVKGRPIDKGDELPIGTIGPHQAAFVGRMERSAKEGDSFVTVPWSIDGSFVFAKGPIRIMEGLQYDWFTKESQRTFVTEPYTITMQADRMGYRLEGVKLTFKENGTLFLNRSPLVPFRFRLTAIPSSLWRIGRRQAAMPRLVRWPWWICRVLLR